MKINKEEFRKQIRELGLMAYEEVILSSLEPALAIERTPCDFVPIGQSKFGGRPDLPPDIDYPAFEGEPFIFLAQYRLEDLAVFPLARDLPGQGLLSFFCLEDGSDGKVIYWGGDVSLLRPYEREGVDIYPQAEMTFVEHDVFNRDHLETSIDRYFDRMVEMDDDEIGLADVIVNDLLPLHPSLQARYEDDYDQILGRGADIVGYRNITDEGDTLLLQMHRDRSHWERLHFFIKPDDLKKLAFERSIYEISRDN